MMFSMGLLKPDCLHRQLEDVVYAMILNCGLEVVFKKRMKLEMPVIREFYGEWHDRHFYEGLCEYMDSGKVEIFVVEGKNAIFLLDEIVGGHSSTGLIQDNVRSRFATSKRENVIHATKNAETFKRELTLLLGGEATKWTGIMHG